ncbi:MAG: prolyl oligopeptidase family serine peptidase [Vicinamibacterales bacterium]
MRHSAHSRSRQAALLMALVASMALAASAAAQGKRAVTFQDLMRFRAIQNPVISDDGRIVAYGAQPDRGNGEGFIHVVPTGKVITVPRGSQPAISKDGRWVGMVVRPSFAATEKAGRERPKNAMALVNVETGAVTEFADVDRFAFSDDSRFVAIHLAPPPSKKTDKPTTEPESEPGPSTLDESAETTEAGQSAGSAESAKERKVGGTLKLRQLDTGTDTDIPNVSGFAFDPASRVVAYSVSEATAKGNGVFVRDLKDPATPTPITQAEAASYANLSWTRDGSALAFVAALEREVGKPGPASVWTWDPVARKGREAVAPKAAPSGWTLPFTNNLAWSRDGKRLFFGFKPGEPEANTAAKPASKPDAAVDPYDEAALLQKVELDIWHWKDPRINSAQKKNWNREKDRTYRAVLHVESGKVVPLASLDVPEVEVPENPRVALATSDVPYAIASTWGDSGRDVYIVDLATGAKKKILEKLEGRASMSPDGRFVAFFKDSNWHIFDVMAGTSRNVTEGIKVPLTDETHDTPSTPPAHGLGGWVDEGAAILVYDRFDIWQIPAAGGQPLCITNGDGRRQALQFRVVSTDRDESSIKSGAPLLLSSYHDLEKTFGFYAATAGKPGIVKRIHEPKRFRVLAKAGKADTLLFTREAYGEFPDLWVSDPAFSKPVKVSTANPQVEQFDFGKAELVSWTSLDGLPLQGVLIKPANYKEGTRYPVITYFYELQSNRLYEWNETVVNHRPSFPLYAGAGYAIFLPDIVFEPGRPGPSILRCLLPGVQKLVDMGIADPKALGLHGHSWGGYGTAYLVTQTKMFAAAVTGAPVANMTSAYSGIRWESGIARQHQYEKGQSRIGGSLWEYPERYIENSPVFFADRVTTPLLIEHGDEDGAVPWYQSIELYLALRRLGKEAIFLQYRGEPHHVQKYPNKLDYAIKMKEFFDHYLKGAPAPDWIKKGVPYSGQ